MKILFLLLIFRIASGLTAQPFESIFGRNSTMWIVQWENLDFGGIDSIVVEKDTVVSGIIWKKVISTQPYSDFAALIREDTISGKIWYRHSGFYSESEYLVFDFSLVTGDTFDLSANYTHNLISTVDSTYYIGNTKHILFDVSVHPNESEHITWIEGVSGNQSPIYKQSNGFLWPYLLCAYKDGIQTYANISFDGNCNPPTAISYPDVTDEIVIYPNPSDGVFYLKTVSDLVFSEVEVYDALGINVFREQFENSINIQCLEPGAYYIKLITDRGKFFIQPVFSR